MTCVLKFLTDIHPISLCMVGLLYEKTVLAYWERSFVVTETLTLKRICPLNSWSLTWYTCHKWLMKWVKWHCLIRRVVSCVIIARRLWLEWIKKDIYFLQGIQKSMNVKKVDRLELIRVWLKRKGHPSEND